MNDTHPQSHFNVSLGVWLSFKHALRSSGLVSHLSDKFQGTKCFREDLGESQHITATKMQSLMAAQLPAPEKSWASDKPPQICKLCGDAAEGQSLRPESHSFGRHQNYSSASSILFPLLWSLWSHHSPQGILRK